MNLKLFSSTMQTTFKQIAFDPSNLILNGSFKSSYWASDIDLYEPVAPTKANLKSLFSHLQTLQTSYLNAVEFKQFLKTTTKKTKNPTKIRNSCQMLKVEMILTHILPYPIECSIIFDFYPSKTYSLKHVTDGLIADISSQKYSRLKRLKRLKSLCKIHKLEDEAVKLEKVLDDTKIGVLNLSKTRLELVKGTSSAIISDVNKVKILEWVQEDLRKIGVKQSNIDEHLDRRVKELLKPIEFA